jgi:hypothetical protein
MEGNASHLSRSPCPEQLPCPRHVVPPLAHRPVLQSPEGSARPSEPTRPWVDAWKPREWGRTLAWSERRKSKARFYVRAPRPVPPARGLAALAPPLAARPNDSAALTGTAAAPRSSFSQEFSHCNLPSEVEDRFTGRCERAPATNGERTGLPGYRVSASSTLLLCPAHPGSPRHGRALMSCCGRRRAEPTEPLAMARKSRAGCGTLRVRGRRSSVGRAVDS